MYHSVYVDRPHKGGIHRDMLRAHLQWLANHGWRGCAVRDHLSDARAGDVCLTFDDGYENNLVHVLPLLSEFGFKATFFVCTRMQGKVLDWHVDDPQPLMGADGWKELARCGHEVASHGLTHRRIDLLDEAGICEELERSREDLEQVVGKVCGYAYPQGHFNRTSLEVVRKGYQYACTTRARWRLLQDAWTIKRINVSDRDDTARFAKKMSLPFRLACDLGY